MTIAQEIIQLKPHGPIFKLAKGVHLTEVKQRHRASEEHRPFHCHFRHDRQVIGLPNTDDPDPVEATLALISTTFARKLVQCQRCGMLETQNRAY